MRFLLPLAALLIANTAAAQSQAPAPASTDRLLPEHFYSSEDGALDLSSWLLERKGFLPVPIFITEPAIGFGAGLAVVFIRDSLGSAASRARQSGRRATPPDIYAAAAFKTENGSQGAGGGGLVTFDDDHYRWRGGGGVVSMNLDFYGNGGTLPPIHYNLKGWASVQHAMLRLGDSDNWLVGRWNWFDFQNRADVAAGLADIPDIEVRSKASGLGLTLEHDSRDNIFTPNSGWTGSVDLTWYDPRWGSQTKFQVYRGHAFGYWPATPSLVVSGRADLRAANGDVPFYQLPYIDLRGVPVGRLQDQRTAVGEVELRWNVTTRWGVVGFVGGGRAWGNRTDFDDGTETVSKGFGLRYQIARALGLWAGVDLAWSTQDRAFYLQVGSAWR